MAHLNPLEVTATFAHGIAHALPWATSLDGLLAAQIWRQTKAAARARGDDLDSIDDVDNPPDLDLPLARCTMGGRDWHWAATFGYLDLARPDPETRIWTARADHRELERLAAPLPATISDRQGRYRSRHMPLLVSTARTARWRAVGDPAAITELLTDVRAIGKKRAAGEGRVLTWTVTPLAGVDDWAAGHLYPDGSLGRLAPIDCLINHDDECDHGPLTMMGLRPPYMHASRRAPVLQPATPT